MIRGFDRLAKVTAGRAGALAVSAALVCTLSFPSLAFAAVRVDDTELAQGENAVGGGSATLADSSLDMVGVTAFGLYADEDLSMNFNGGKLEEGSVAGKKVSYVDTSSNNGEDVDLKANGQPAYYRCCDNKATLPKGPLGAQATTPTRFCPWRLESQVPQRPSTPPGQTAAWQSARFPCVCALG